MTESDLVAALLARAPLKFTPVETFISDEFKSDYIKGLTYTLRLTSVQDDPQRLCVKLATCMVRWLAAGQITLDVQSAPAGTVKVAGAGVVG